MTLLSKRVLEIATGEIGVHEIAGEQANPRIIEYHSCVALKATSDEISWCSSFVNWCLKQAGITGTNNAMARSFMHWGIPVEPFTGCIVVLKRGFPPSGHVGFYIKSIDNLIKVLGGNQGDMVKVSRFNAEDVLVYRWIVEDIKK